METIWQGAWSWCVPPVWAEYLKHFISHGSKSAILTNESIYPVYLRPQQLRDRTEITYLSALLWFQTQCVNEGICTELHISSELKVAKTYDKHDRWWIMLAKHFNWSLCLKLSPLLLCGCIFYLSLKQAALYCNLPTGINGACNSFIIMQSDVDTGL